MIMHIFKDFIQNEDGATAIEYGLIAALIAVGLIVGAGALGTSVNALLGDTNGEIQSVID